MLSTIPFQVTRMAACVPAGVPLEWQGQTYSSGPLVLELDHDESSHGQLDYSAARAQAEFRVKLSFPEFSQTLRDLGADASLAEPIRATLRSEGPILADHSFALRGVCRLVSHPLFGGGTAASVLPGN